MPNSQVVASPYPSDDVANWVLELYISPSGTTVWIVIAVVCALVVLGAVVAFLHYREKKQDELEKKEKEHLFSFKAL
jgi:heme/copper-type cytochrome/quinol oxidase subunit 2